MVMRIVCAAGATLVLVMSVARAQAPLRPSELREHPSIAYSRSTPRDPVARLNERLARGEVSLAYDAQGGGYLKSVLDALQVPIESQVLVFSKTSFQAPKINPRNPRALFFNDTVSVGWVRGGDVVEVIGQDPALGSIFYTLEQTPPGAAEAAGSAGAAPRLKRNGACVSCHTSEATLDVPGPFAGSVFPDPDGMPHYVLLTTVDHRTPFDLRWGGWYVTGRHAGERHLGNAVVAEGAEAESMATKASSHLERLDGKFDPKDYLTPTSDIVALLVLEHQMRMQNLITRVGWEARVGAEASGRRLEAAVEELVDYLLLVEEAELPGPISGPTSYAQQFAAAGPRDRRGRSLRELDLQTRLLRYPCSWLIYSEPFEALPGEVKALVYARMWRILSGEETAPRYARLDPGTRRAIVEILVDTKPHLPAYFREVHAARP